MLSGRWSDWVLNRRPAGAFVAAASRIRSRRSGSILRDGGLFVESGSFNSHKLFAAMSSAEGAESASASLSHGIFILNVCSKTFFFVPVFFVPPPSSSSPSPRACSGRRGVVLGTRNERGVAEARALRVGGSTTNAPPSHAAQVEMLPIPTRQRAAADAVHSTSTRNVIRLIFLIVSWCG